MGEEPKVDDFIRQLQAELEMTKSITDPKEQQHRMWQIETAIQEAILFNSRWKQIAKIGKEPLRIVKTALNEENKSPQRIVSSNQSTSDECPKCGSIIEDDLDFCAACGNYSK